MSEGMNLIGGGPGRFTIEERSDCVLVFGALSAKWLNAINHVVPDAIISPELARMAQANLAFGTEEAVEKLIGELRPRVQDAAARKYAHSGLSEAAVRWLASGARGISSETMFTHLTGVDALRGWDANHPRDPDDFRRCLLLLLEVPELVQQLPRMAEVSPVWAQLVENWQTIANTLERECGGDIYNPTPGARAEETYNLIKTAIRGA